MGVFELFAYIVLIVLLAFGAIWVIKRLAPDHPVIIDNAIWVVAVIMVFVMLASAFGLLGHDLKVPRLGGLLRSR
jgi:hypothetical protein